MATANRKSTAKPQAEKPEKIEEPTAEIVTTYEQPVTEETHLETTAETENLTVEETLPRDFDLPVVKKEELTPEEEKVIFAEDVVPPNGEPDMTPIINAPFVAPEEPQKDETNYYPINADGSVNPPEEFVEIPGEEELVEEPKCDLTLPIEAPFIPVLETKAPEPVVEPVIVPAPAPRVKKSFAQMTASEFNIYMKTGIIPFL
jgi:hypothetical protein